MRARTRRAIAVLAAAVLCATTAAAGADVTPVAARSRERAETCTATVRRRTVHLSKEQADNATLIAAIAAERGLPPRAVAIAIATAYEESDLTSVAAGHRGEVATDQPTGLFAPAPLPAAGRARPVRHPRRATHAFFDRLEKVQGYRRMPISDAVRAVQGRSFPAVHRDHAAEARVVAAAVTGRARASFSCVVPGRVRHGSDRLNGDGLTRRAARVRRQAERALGDLSLGGFQPGGVRDGHMPGSAHYDGRALDIFVRPISPRNKQRGWEIASYLVAHADRLHIETIIFDSRVWQASDSEDGWERYDAGDLPGDRDILQHRDHVHVDVFD